MSFLKNIFVGCRRNSFNCSNLECPLPTNNMFYFWNIFNSLAQICKILPLSPFPLHLQPLFSLSLYLSFFFKNGPTPASFHVFSSFQTNITILTTIKCEKCPSSIRCLDLNSQPFDSKSPPLTTRPGLLPKPQALLLPVMVKRQYDDGFLHAFGSTGIHGHW